MQVQQQPTNFGCSKCRLGKKIIEIMIKNGVHPKAAANYLDNRTVHPAGKRLENWELTHEFLTQALFDTWSKVKGKPLERMRRKVNEFYMNIK